MKCPRCNNFVEDYETTCPYCGNQFLWNVSPLIHVHNADDFPENYGKRHFVEGVSLFLRCLLAFIVGNIIGVIFYWVYRTSYNRSLFYYRLQDYDSAYACRVKANIYRFLFVLSIPFNIYSYMIYSIKLLLHLLFGMKVGV